MTLNEIKKYFHSNFREFSDGSNLNQFQYDELKAFIITTYQAGRDSYHTELQKEGAYLISRKNLIAEIEAELPEERNEFEITQDYGDEAYDRGWNAFRKLVKNIIKRK